MTAQNNTNHQTPELDTTRDRRGYVLPAFTGAWGLLPAVAGYLLSTAASRDVIVGLVEGGRITSLTMSDAQLIGSIFTLQWAISVVLFVVGLGLVGMTVVLTRRARS